MEGAGIIHLYEQLFLFCFTNRFTHSLKHWCYKTKTDVFSEL